MTSVRRFRQDFVGAVLDLHWRQWCALGVASSVTGEKRWIIDLEALLCSTLFVGTFDKRLLSVPADWAARNGAWLNFSRLKRIGRRFCEADMVLSGPLVRPKTFESAVGALKNVSEGVRSRKTVTEPNLRNGPLLQLALRGVFGVNARAEVLLYLHARPGGNSNQIAQEVCFDQKIVYRVLEKWALTGLVRKEQAGRRMMYVLEGGGQLAEAVGWKQGLEFANWIRAFHLWARILKALHTKPWCEDEYLLSSFFRDVSGDAGLVGRSVKVSISDARLYEGTEYFAPFAGNMMEVLRSLARRAPR